MKYLLIFLLFGILMLSCGDDSGRVVDNCPDLDPIERCKPLDASVGNIINVTPDQVANLQSIIYDAEEGDVIVLDSGTYDLNGQYLWVRTPGVTIRSKTGNPDDVIIDGNYKTTEIITVAASDVTIAEITLQKAYTHPIHVTSSALGDTLNTMIYRVTIIDPRE